MPRKRKKAKSNPKKRTDKSVMTIAEAYQELKSSSVIRTEWGSDPGSDSGYSEQSSLDMDEYLEYTECFSTNQTAEEADRAAFLLKDSELSKIQSPTLSGSLNVNLAGASFYGGFSPGKVAFHAEPSNPYDSNAVAVVQNELMIGHLPRVLVADSELRNAILEIGRGIINSLGAVTINLRSSEESTINRKKSESASIEAQPIDPKNNRSLLVEQPNSSMVLISVRVDGNYLTISTDQGSFKNRIDYAPAGIVEKCKNHIGRNIELKVRPGTDRSGKTWKELGWFVDITDDIAAGRADDVGNNPQANAFHASLPTGKKFEEHSSQKVYGPPGTGKTTSMIEHVREAIEKGVSPENIAFISFSNAGANAAKNKVSKGLKGFSAADFPHFSTMHSLATKIDRGAGKTLCQEEHLKEFDRNITCFKEWTEVNDPFSAVTRFKHAIIDLYALAMSKQTSFATEYNRVKDDERTCKQMRSALEKYFEQGIREDQVLNYSEKYLTSYKKFKDENNLVDFNDVIERIISKDFDDSRMPTFELLIIDEAQDLSDALWIFAKKLIDRARTVYISGDDDQAIMVNFGASPNAFYELKTTKKDFPLPKSYRVPEAVMRYVRKGVLPIVEALDYRVEKEWDTADHPGTVQVESERNTKDTTNQYKEFTLNDLLSKVRETQDEEWLIMAPTRQTGEKFSKALLEQVPPIEHFYRNKPTPNLNPRDDVNIRVQSIHTSKGDEAKNAAIIVATLGDIAMLANDPRLAYVALTRAKEVMYPRVIAKQLLSAETSSGSHSWAVGMYKRMFPLQ